MAGYAELAITSNFSFLRGAAHPEEFITQAVALRLAGIGIADRNSVAGVVRAHDALRQLREQDREDPDHFSADDRAALNALRFVPGARLIFSDGTPDILAYPQDRAGWARLTRLLSLGKRRADKGECLLGLADLLEFREGLNLIVMPPRRISAKALTTVLNRLKTAAAKHVWLGASILYRGDDERRLARLSEIARDTFVPMIAVNDVLYHRPERRMLQDVIACIREHVAIDNAGRLLEANAERHLKPADEMARLFRHAPGAIAQTTRFLAHCRFDLSELGKTEYPEEAREGFDTPQQALVAFAEEGARRRFADGMPPHIRHALNEELRLIGELDYAPFFLTVHDIVKQARAIVPPILCQGRGSAANSIICYCLGITDVDPRKNDLLFERFVSVERREPPDIDVDFEHERREEIIQYIYERYTRERAGIAATVICYRGRSAVREVGKAFGLSKDTVAALASSLWGWSTEGVPESEVRRLGLDPADPRLKLALTLSQELIGFPRHLSQHVGGFVITRSRLDEVVPIENAAMEDRTVIEWDKDDLEKLGLLKVDVLGLGMLTCLRRSFDFLQQHYGVTRNLAQQDEDPATYEMIQRADTIGVFQIESRAQMSMLPRLKPAKFYDLVIEVAIVRPGPIQGDMVHPYLKRRENPQAVKFPSPAPEHGPPDELQQVLGKTLGVPLFQEQAMRIAIVAAKFPPGQADKLRRAMATFKRVGTIKTFRDKFIGGMTARGYELDFATRCFNQIEGFGEYGFPESHAASFANLVYASSYLKCRYPDVFAAALLNSQPMGFYASSQIIRDAQDHGVAMRAVDVNHSDWDATLEPDVKQAIHPRHAAMRDHILSHHAVRLGLREVKGLSEDHGRVIAQVRSGGFDSIRDLWLRTHLPPTALEALARADTFRSLGLDRRQALWSVRALRRTGDKDDLPLFAQAAMPEQEADFALPPMPPGQHVVEDYRHLRFSLKAHPVAFLRGEFDKRSILRSEGLPDIRSGSFVTVGGIVLVRQRPGSANGVIFMTLEDETGVANAIVWPQVFETFRPVVLGARLVRVTGKLQNEAGVIHVVASIIEDLTPLLRRLSDEGGEIETLARCDEVKRPEPGNRSTKKREHDQARLLALHQDGALVKAMPKGRNFH